MTSYSRIIYSTRNFIFYSCLWVCIFISFQKGFSSKGFWIFLETEISSSKVNFTEETQDRGPFPADEVDFGDDLRTGSSHTRLTSAKYSYSQSDLNFKATLMMDKNHEREDLHIGSHSESEIGMINNVFFDPKLPRVCC